MNLFKNTIRITKPSLCISGFDLTSRVRKRRLSKEESSIQCSYKTLLFNGLGGDAPDELNISPWVTPSDKYAL